MVMDDVMAADYTGIKKSDSSFKCKEDNNAPENECFFKSADDVYFPPSDITTLNIPPRKPVCTPVSSTTIKVAWEDSSNGHDLNSYEIKYKPITADTKQWCSKCTDCGLHEINISDLLANTSYCFQVRALCDITVGPFSEMSDPVSTFNEMNDLDTSDLSSTTHHPASTIVFPSQTQINRPGKPAGETISSNSIELKWKSPEQTTGVIDCYEVRYKDMNPAVTRWQSTWTDNDETVVRIQSLTENRGYIVKVRPIIGGEDGIFSESVEFFTQKKDVDRPGIPYAIEVSQTQLIVGWDETRDKDPSQSHYEVRYREKNGAKKWKSIATENCTNKIKLTSLKENTTYEFKVRAVFEEKDGPFNEQVGLISTATYGAEGPLDNGQCLPPVIESADPNSMTLTWQQPQLHVDDVDYYEIRYKEEGQTKVFSVKADANKNKIFVSGLKDKTTYEFKIRAIINGEDGLFSKTMSAKTPSVSSVSKMIAKTGPAINVNVTTESIALKWHAGNVDTDKLLYFEVRYRECNRHNAKWMSTNTCRDENEITISNLKPDTKYEFKIRPVLQDEDGIFSDICVMATDGISDQPGIPKFKTWTSCGIMFTWDHPEGSKEVDAYDVRYRESSSEKWVFQSTNRNEITISNLNENSTYYLKVRAIFGETEGQFSKTACIETDKTSKMSIEKPNIIEIHNDGVILDWKVTPQAKNADRFEVQYRKNSGGEWLSKFSNESKITIQELQPKTDYEFMVRPISKNIDHPFSDIVGIRTKHAKRCEAKTIGLPTQVNASFDTIEIEWKIPTSVEDIKYYEVRHRKYKTEKWLISTSEKNKAVITNLQPSEVYEFKVRAMFENTVGSFSKIAQFSTNHPEVAQSRLDKSQPGKPQAVSLGYCHILLEWSDSDLKKNDVQCYEIKYRDCQSKKFGKWNYVHTETNENKHKVNNLNSNKEYQFCVRAIYREKSESPLSIISENFRTSTCIIKKIQQTSATPNSVTIYWDKPEFLEDVECFEAIYRQHGSSAQQWQSAKTNENEVTITGLKGSTGYEVKVRCILQEGSSDFGDLIPHAKTSEREMRKFPGKPIEVLTTARTVRLRWNASELKKIDNYEVRYRECGTETKQWKSVFTENDFLLHTVTDLKCATDYEFKVAVVINGESGPFSEASQKMCTKLSLAKNIQLDTQTLIEKGPPKRFKLPVVVTTIDEAAKTRKCILDYQIFKQNRTHTASGTGKSGGKLSKAKNWINLNICGIPSKPVIAGLNEKTIMLVGATGSGKSTLIDGMINYITDVSWEDDFRFSLIDMTQDERKHCHDQTVSQTDWITTYKIPIIQGSKLDYSLNIIDTPGFGDTRGITRDKEIISQITRLFESKGENGIRTLDAVCFVVQSPLARLTHPQLYIFDSILSLFGKDIGSNIFVLITFADGKKPPVIDALKKADVPFKLDFKLNNSALFETNNETSKDSFAKMFWKMGEESFRNFFRHLKSVDAKSLQLTADVLRTRSYLEVVIEGLQKQITDGMNQLNTMRQEGEILKRHKTDIASNKNFQYEVEEVVMTQIILEPGEYVTNCLKCNISCHYPCHIPNDDGKKRCKAMGGKESCRICPNNCHWTQHKNAQFRLEAVKQKVEKTYEELRKKFEVAKREATNQFAVLKRVKQKFLNLQTEVTLKIREVRKCINDLDRFALKPNPLSDIDYIDLLIHSEEHEMKYGWEDRIKLLETFRKEALVILQAKTGQFEPFKSGEEILKSFEI